MFFKSSVSHDIMAIIDDIIIMYRIPQWIITRDLSFLLLLSLQVVKVRSFILMFNVSAGISMHYRPGIFHT